MVGPGRSMTCLIGKVEEEKICRDRMTQKRDMSDRGSDDRTRLQTLKDDSETQEYTLFPIWNKYSTH